MLGKLVPLISCLALASAGVVPVASPSGFSQQSRSQDDLGNYSFGYDIVGPYGDANGRQEKGDSYGNKVGSYVIQDIDGRSRRVDYVADENGFRATISTNEPGTVPSDPANAQYNAAPAQLVAAAPSYAQPAYAPQPARFVAAPQYAPALAPARLIAPAPVAVQAPLFAAPQRLVAAPAPVAVAPRFAAPLVAPQPIAAPIAAPLFAPRPIAVAQPLAAPVAHAPLFAPRPLVAQRLVAPAPVAVQAAPVFANHGAPVFANHAAPLLRAAPVAVAQAPLAVPSPFAFSHNIVHAAPQFIRKA